MNEPTSDLVPVDQEPLEKPKIRSELPTYTYLDISREQIEAAIMTDRRIISYQVREQELDAMIALMTEREIHEISTLEEIRTKKIQIQAQLRTIDRELRERRGVLKSTIFHRRRGEKLKVQLNHRWKIREVQVYKMVVNGTLRTLSTDLIPKRTFGNKIVGHD